MNVQNCCPSPFKVECMRQPHSPGQREGWVVCFSVRHKAKRALFLHANEAQGDRNLAEPDPSSCGPGWNWPGHYIEASLSTNLQPAPKTSSEINPVPNALAIAHFFGKEFFRLSNKYFGNLRAQCPDPDPGSFAFFPEILWRC